jgi:NADPH-dependent ferric siderophore reductase
MMRVTLGGEELRGFPSPEPAASVRLLVPEAHDAPVTLPTWAGNEFLFDDGTRPAIRTLTPGELDPASLQISVDIVQHGEGRASEWATSVTRGDRAALAGPGRGYTVDRNIAGLLIAGDETALLAISQVMVAAPSGAPVVVHIEVADRDARIALPAHDAVTVHWHTTPPGDMPGAELVRSVTAERVPDGWAVWAAGEAAGMQRIRKHLFDGLGVARDRTTVRGYWKHGRRATDGN